MVNGVPVNDYKVDGSNKPPSPVAITAGATTYVLTATVNGKEHIATYKVTGTETSKRAPVVIKANYEAGKCVTKSSTSSDYTGAAPVLNGITIEYWSIKQNAYVQLDLAELTPGTAGKQNGTNNYWVYTDADNDFTLTITNTQPIHDGKQIYGMPVVYDGKLWFVLSDTNGMVSSGSSARTIKMKYEFQDNNGGELTFENSWSVAYDKNNKVAYNTFCGTGSSTCIAEGSMITMADGSKKAVEDIRRGDMVMAFDHVTGKVVYKEVVLVGKTYADVYYRNVLVFDDGTELNAINEHGIYDLDLNQYVNIGHENYLDYIGHRFVSIDSNGNIGVKRLVDVVTTVEAGYKYDIVTNETLTYVVEDTLSVSHEIVMIMNSFVFGDNMTYDAEAMQADIDEYGLYTYEDFAEYCDRETFEKYNMAIMKVCVGKGICTYEHIVYLLTEIALNDEVQIID